MTTSPLSNAEIEELKALESRWYLMLRDAAHPWDKRIDDDYSKAAREATPRLISEIEAARRSESTAGYAMWNAAVEACASVADFEASQAGTCGPHCQRVAAAIRSLIAPKTEKEVMPLGRTPSPVDTQPQPTVANDTAGAVRSPTGAEDMHSVFNPPKTLCAPPPGEGEIAKHPSVDDTVALIKRLHAEQIDKGGEEYWRHPVSVMRRIPGATDHECHVALLHDVLEDTSMTAQGLLRLGYLFEVVWDVNTVTRRRSSGSYSAWIETIATLGERAAIRVKIADNLDPDRLAKLPASERERLTAKYIPAPPTTRKK